MTEEQLFNKRSPAGRPSQGLTKVIHFAATPAERAWVKREAHRKQMSMSGFLRAVLSDYRKRKEERECTSD